MEKALLHTHGFLRWVILILLIIAIYRSFTAKGKPFTEGHRKTGLFLMIFCDITLLIGLYQWFTGPLGLKNIQASGMSAVMKDSVSRFFAIEHMLGMIIAIILVHLGYSFAKKPIPDAIKHKRTWLFYAIALLIMLVVIPWPFRDVGAGRPWFPGM